MEIKFRPAEKEDCEKIASLNTTASDGIVESLFHDLVPGMSPTEVMAYNLRKGKYPHSSYRSVIVACDGDQVIGMAFSYPSSYHEITDEMRRFFPAERLDQFNDFFSSRIENTWFFNGMCIDDSYRGQGIGQQLQLLTEEKAIENGYNTMCGIVFPANTGAMRFHQRNGCEIVKKVELKKDEFIKHEGGCVLVKWTITR